MARRSGCRREAESRWPDVAYRADAPADDARAIEPVLEVLAELSPTVEWSTEPAQAPLASRNAPAVRYAIFLDGTDWRRCTAPRSGWPG